MIVVDADGHVEESPSMFRLLEPEFQPRRPLAMAFDNDTAYAPYNAVWLIDGKVYPKMIGKGGVTLGTPTIMERAKLKPASIPAQELTDVPDRLRDLDKAGIDTQVVYPTLFLTTTTEDVRVEAAFYRAYNSFLGEACAQSGGRIRFAALAPVRDLDESAREMRRAKELGAVSVFTCGTPWGMNHGDPALHRLYAAAAALDLAVCIHFGWGNPAYTDVFEAGQSFNSALLPVLMGTRSLLASGVLERIPNLRVAFLEAGSLWLPWLLHQIGRGGGGGRRPADYFREGRAYIACEADEDINYLASCVGEDCLVVASDYPHGDPSHEDNLKAAVWAREDVPLRVREKILSANPRRLYGL